MHQVSEEKLIFIGEKKFVTFCLAKALKIVQKILNNFCYAAFFSTFRSSDPYSLSRQGLATQSWRKAPLGTHSEQIFKNTLKLVVGLFWLDKEAPSFS